MNINADVTPDTDIPDCLDTNNMSEVIAAFMLWLKLCVSCMWPFEIVYDYEIEKQPIVLDYISNRYYRRVADKNVPIERYSCIFRNLLPRGLSQAQFVERVSRYSIYGRRRFYRLRNKTRPMTTQRLSKTPHKAPTSEIVSLNSGIWDAHLWPS